jgi:flagellin
MTSQVRGLNQAVRNANDAISMIQVAEGAMKEVTNMFQRMRELAVQSISDSNTNADRTALNNEYKQLSSEVGRIAENTQWNGTNILDGARTETTFQIGANANQTIKVNFGDLSNDNIKVAQDNTADLTLAFSGGLPQKDDIVSFKVNDNEFASFKFTAQAANGELQMIATDKDGATIADAAELATATISSADASAGTFILTITDNTGTAVTKVSDAQLTRGTHGPVASTDITTSNFATTALGALDTAIEGVNSTRAGLGASMSRLEYASDNLQNVSQNTQAARSRVLDADYAAETTELARTQIIQQASTAMLSQANQSQQSVLSLLR